MTSRIEIARIPSRDGMFRVLSLISMLSSESVRGQLRGAPVRRRAFSPFLAGVSLLGASASTRLHLLYRSRRDSTAGFLFSPFGASTSS